MSEEINVIYVDRDNVIIQVTPADPVVVIEREEPEVTVIESIESGPQGPPGDDGMGATPGTNNGDILRWNSVTSQWEVVSEPFVFDEIQLTPKASSTGPEGTVYFCSLDKYIYVAVDF